MHSLKHFSFARPELAKQYCESLVGNGLRDSRSGLFLAAPRRTGKSTFLIEDLIPAMCKRKWITIYVDLWAEKSRDPVALIVNAILKKIESYEGTVARVAKATGLEKVTVMGTLGFNFNKPAVDLTVTDALEILADVANTPVALIIDEAQHALSTKTGIDAMFALKSSRDQLNLGHIYPSGEQRIFLVMTGSNRDKLAQLLLKRIHPFFGAEITRFPLLGRDFTDAYADFVNPHLAADNQFDRHDLFEAFKLIGHRPGLLRHIIEEIESTQCALHLKTSTNGITRPAPIHSRSLQFDRC